MDDAAFYEMECSVCGERSCAISRYRQHDVAGRRDTAVAPDAARPTRHQRKKRIASGRRVVELARRVSCGILSRNAAGRSVPSAPGSTKRAISPPSRPSWGMTSLND